MLPDFPEIKKQLDALLSNYIQHRVRFHLGFMSQIPRKIVPEGCHTRLIRADGSVDDVKMQQACGTEHMDTPPENMPDMRVVLSKLNSIAEQIARHQARYLYKRVAEVTEKTGNVVQAKKSEIGLKTLVDILERIQIEFDATGKPILPSVVCSKEMFEQFMVQGDTAFADSVQQARMDEVIARKREEYRDRESRRRLVN